MAACAVQHRTARGQACGRVSRFVIHLSPSSHGPRSIAGTTSFTATSIRGSAHLCPIPQRRTAKTAGVASDSLTPPACRAYPHCAAAGDHRRARSRTTVALTTAWTHLLNGNGLDTLDFGLIACFRYFGALDRAWLLECCHRFLAASCRWRWRTTVAPYLAAGDSDASGQPEDRVLMTLRNEDPESARWPSWSACAAA